VAAFFNSKFQAREPVSYDQVIVMSGVTSVLDALTWSICNEGEGIMIPQPLYTGFQVDICERSRGVIVPVPFQGVEGYETFDDAFKPATCRVAFERALEDARRRGIRVKAALLTKYAPLDMTR
jgi:aspartate/methionine/tyrosine aminotransferase